MDTSLLRGFAVAARVSLLRGVGARLAVVLAAGSDARVVAPGAVAELERAVAAEGGGEVGRQAVGDRVAYVWFNRLIALRFMDASGMTPVGVVSPGAGGVQPEVLAQAKRGMFDSAVVSRAEITRVTRLLDHSRMSANPDADAYGVLLVAYCRFWNRSMPFLFEREADYTELLMPVDLLADESVRARAVQVMSPDVCADVEVIGWLYQFYISERKDEVFAGFKKNKKAGAAEIPAATQLFTPHWIVRYLVENSLGRLWLLNNPDSSLQERMEYYIAPVDEETDFLRVSSPEELKLIDPACGSGHMLTYAFDLLYAIYEEQGYPPSEIPGLILSKNLYGTEIDSRAGGLAAFALTMKARQRQRTFLATGVKPNICVLEPVRFTPEELRELNSPLGNFQDEESFWNLFQDADTFGALLQPDDALIEPLTAHLDANPAQDLLDSELHERARKVLAQAEYLSQRYHVVVANPPYMGSRNMNAPLAAWLKLRYSHESRDLFAAFLNRMITLLRYGGYMGCMAPNVLMYVSTYKHLRELLRSEHTLVNLLEPPPKALVGVGIEICLTVTQKRTPRPEQRIGLIDLPEGESEERTSAAEMVRAAAADPAHPFRIQLRPAAFEGAPGGAFLVRLKPEYLELFSRFPPLSDLAQTGVGVQTGNVQRFIRYWFEVGESRIGFDMANRREAAASQKRWFPHNKAGSSVKWFGNLNNVVNWMNDGEEIRQNKPHSNVSNVDLYFRASGTWSLIGGKDVAFRFVPPGYVFDIAAPSFFCADVASTRRIVGALNSTIAKVLLRQLAPTLNSTPGDVGKVPVPLDALDKSEYDALLNELFQASEDSIRKGELSRGFQRHPLVDGHPSQLRLLSVFRRMTGHALATELRIDELQWKIDEFVCRAYGFDGVPVSRPAERQKDLVSDDTHVHQFISYAVGCIFGRYSLDVPGLVLADQGDTLDTYLTKVSAPSFLPDRDNVIPIVDGGWFEDDIVARFRQFLRVSFGAEHFEENVRFIEDTLGKSLRKYFGEDFYADHVKRYSKRPIYWLFSSPTGSFSALIYLHRYAPSTVGTILTEYLQPYQAKLEAELAQQVYLSTSGTSAPESSAALKAADGIRKVLVELQDYARDVLYPLAVQQVKIDLDDGVKANYPKFGAALKKIPGLETTV